MNWIMKAMDRLLWKESKNRGCGCAAAATSSTKTMLVVAMGIKSRYIDNKTCNLADAKTCRPLKGFPLPSLTSPLHTQPRPSFVCRLNSAIGINNWNHHLRILTTKKRRRLWSTYRHCISTEIAMPKGRVSIPART